MKKTKTSDNGPSASTIVFENGNVIGAVRDYGRGTPTSTNIANARPFVIPKIVISASYSSNSLHRSRSDVGSTTDCGLPDNCNSNYNNYNNNRSPSNNFFNAANTDDAAAERSALLVSQNVLHGMTDEFDVDADTDADADADADADVDCNAVADANITDVNAAEVDAAMTDDDADLYDPSTHDAEFEQFVMNRTTSESNILETSIYSELQFPPSIASGIISHIGIGVTAAFADVGGGSVGGGGAIGVDCNGSMQRIAGPQAAHALVAANNCPPPAMEATTTTTTTTPTTIATTTGTTNTTATVVDMLNTSACSRADSRQSKRSRRKAHKSKSKCSSGTTASAQRNTPVVGVAGGSYPPQYTAIFLDAPHHLQHHHGNAASAIGQIANAAASSPFLNANAAVSSDTGYIQHHSHHLPQYQYFHHRPLMAPMGYHQHQQHRNLLDTAAAPGPSSVMDVAVGTDDAPMGTLNAGRDAGVMRNPDLNSQWSLTFGKWLTRPSLPFVIGILALGGVACTLGGIVLGSTGLIEHSTQYLSAALLMIGIGVSLLVISGAIWRLSLPDDIDDCPCFRHLEACRSCNSPYCANRLMPGNYLYPEFQHRRPPPSYLTSLNECTAMGFFLHPGANAPPPATVVNRPRVNTPPPNYRSTVSLNTHSANPQTNTTLVLPSTSAFANQCRQLPDALPDTNATKEIIYLDLD